MRSVLKAIAGSVTRLGYFNKKFVTNFLTKVAQISGGFLATLQTVTI